MKQKCSKSFKLSPLARSAVLAAGFAVLAGLSPQGAAADTVERSAVNAAKRVAIASRQAMLAESMAKSLCYAHNDVDREDSIRHLYTAWNIYSWYHRGIISGNVQLGLFPESDIDVVQAWSRIDKVWEEVARIHSRVMDGYHVNDLDFSRAEQMTADMVTLNGKLLAQLRAAYSDMIAGQGDIGAFLIDLYERERVLAQRASKQVCLVSKGYESEEMRTSLQENLGYLTITLDGLIAGLPEMGLPPAPSPEIKAQLELAKDRLTSVHHIAAAVAQGVTLPDEELLKFRAGMDQFLSEMNIAVNMLVRHMGRDA